jgi:hypothetical protein
MFIKTKNLPDSVINQGVFVLIHDLYLYEICFSIKFLTFYLLAIRGTWCLSPRPYLILIEVTVFDFLATLANLFNNFLSISWRLFFFSFFLDVICLLSHSVHVYISISLYKNLLV